MKHQRISVPLILLGLFFLMSAPSLIIGILAQSRAERALAVGNNVEASTYFKKAAEHLFWRSDFWEQAGILTQDPLTSLTLLEEAQSRRTLSSEGLIAMGDAHDALGNMEEALLHWQTAQDRGYQSSGLYQRLAQAYYFAGDMDAEIVSLRKWISLEDGNASAYYRLGLLLITSSPEEALSKFNAASRLDDEYTPVVETLRTAINIARYETIPADRLIVIGRALGLVGEWSLAADAFGRATQVDVESALAWAWLGEARQQVGLDGRIPLDTALRLGGEIPVVRSLRAMYWLRQGHPSQALAEYLLAAEYEPENPVWQAALGDVYAQSGDLPPALVAYQRATDLAPEQVVYWRLLAVFSVQYSFLVEEVGLPAALQAAELTPDDPAVLDTLGWVYLELFETELAKENLLRAIKIEPNYAWAHTHLGMVYLQEGYMDLSYSFLIRAQALAGESGAGLQATQILEQYFP
mgnify:CR=1 FL=1